MENNRPYLRRILWSLAIIGAVLIAGSAVYHYSVQPQITIAAPAGSVATLTRLDSTTPPIQRSLTQASLKLYISSGKYALTISNTDQRQTFYPTVRIFQRKTYTLAATKELHRTTLQNAQTAYNPIPDGKGGIDYLDPVARTIDSLIPASSATVISPLHSRARGIYSISGNRAIATVDSTLYLVDHHYLTKIDMAGIPSPITSLIVGTNPSKQSFVVSANYILYWYASPDALPKQVTSFSKAIDQLAYGDNVAIAYSTRMPAATQNLRSSYSTFAIDPIVIDIPGKTQHTLMQGPIIAAAIAPDDKHATIRLQGANTTSIYDLTTGTALYAVLSSDITTPSWTDANHYLYATGSDIWRFDLSSRTATAVGTLPAGVEPTSLTYDSATGSYLVTTYTSDTDAPVYYLSP